MTLHLCTSLSPLFLAPGLVFLDSVCRHSSPRDLALHVFDHGLSAGDRQRLLDLATDHGASLDFQTLGGAPESARGRDLFALSCLRIEGIDRLCRELPRLLAVDADMLVAKPLAPLWDTDLDGHILAAVTDFAHPTFGDIFPYAVERLGGRAGWRYINAGVMLIDCAAWREAGVGARMVEAIRRTPPGAATYGDQDFYPIGCDGRIADLDPVWNAQMVALQHHDKWPDSPLKETIGRRLPDLYEQPGIYHWPGPYKPWLDFPGCDIPGREVYRREWVRVVGAEATDSG